MILPSVGLNSSHSNSPRRLLIRTLQTLLFRTWTPQQQVLRVACNRGATLSSVFAILLATSNFLSGQQAPAASAPPSEQPPGHANEQQPAEASTRQPADSQSASEPASTLPTASPRAPHALKQEAWQILETACLGEKVSDRVIATRVLGLLPNNAKALKLTEKALTDEKPEVRAAAAAALGDMKARTSIAKLREALDDDDPSVALAAAHSLDLLHDDSAFELYYEILTGQRKAGRGIVASQTARLKDPKKLAQLGFEEGIGFIPFAGLGWMAIKTVTKDDSSPVRAAAVKVLTRDPDPATTNALSEAAEDKSWLVRVAALEALAARGDPSMLRTAEEHMSDKKTAVKYTASAVVLRLVAIQENGTRLREQKKAKK